MLKGLEQQPRPADSVFMKTAASPKHGRKPDPLPANFGAAPGVERRSFSPRPGH
ncbi:MAG: hypothetical protein Q8R27_05820 [Phenylobacterium sp.]|nr:hypothetical protein [Phenylobacterium sp.]